MKNTAWALALISASVLTVLGFLAAVVGIPIWWSKPWLGKGPARLNSQRILGIINDTPGERNAYTASTRESQALAAIAWRFPIAGGRLI